MTIDESDRPEALGSEPGPERDRSRHEMVRQVNVERVFQVIVDHAPASRAELVGLTGLSKPTVLRLVAALESEGLIRQAEPMARPHTGAGRIPIRYEPNPRAAFVIGVDVGGTKTMGALADLTGAVVAESEIATASDGGPSLVSQIVDLARTLAGDSGTPWDRVAAVTVGTPGVENPDGTIRLADNIAGLDQLRLTHLLQQSLGVPVQVENDVNLAALGELEAGAARTTRTFALLALGTGLGMGLVIDGQLIRGSRGAGGEVAYLPIGGDPASAPARRYGTFELAASGRGLTAMAAEEVARHRAEPGGGGATVLTPTSSARDIYQAVDQGDPVAARIVARHADLVARAILAVGCLLDPELVVLGGGIGSNPVLLGPVRAALDRIVPWPLPVVSSALGPRSGVVGAIHHALRAVPRLEAATISARIRDQDRSGPRA